MLRDSHGDTNGQTPRHRRAHTDVNTEGLMRWRLRRTKEDSVATLPPCHQRPAGGIISQGMEDTSSPRTFQSPADVPLRPGSRLWWRGGLQRLFFFYIQCQALTHTYIHTGGQISTLTGKMLYANTLQTPFLSKKTHETFPGRST